MNKKCKNEPKQRAPNLTSFSTIKKRTRDFNPFLKRLEIYLLSVDYLDICLLSVYYLDY